MLCKICLLIEEIKLYLNTRSLHQKELDVGITSGIATFIVRHRVKEIEQNSG